MRDTDTESDGYVWDLTKVWAHQPALDTQFSALIIAAGEAAGLSRREKAMLVLGKASAVGVPR